MKNVNQTADNDDEQLPELAEMPEMELEEVSGGARWPVVGILPQLPIVYDDL